MSEPDNRLWHHDDHGTPRGPVPFDALRALVNAGALRPETLVWGEGLADWTPAARVPPVAALFAGRAITPPPLPPVAQYNNTFRAPPVGETAGVRMLIPVGRSPWAIAAGYLGLFSVLLVFAPFALVAGLIARRELRRNPHLHGQGRAWFGIIMGGLFTVALIAMIVALVADSW